MCLGRGAWGSAHPALHGARHSQAVKTTTTSPRTSLAYVLMDRRHAPCTRHIPVAFVLGLTRTGRRPATRTLSGWGSWRMRGQAPSFVCPPLLSHPRIDAIKPAAGGRRKAARLSTEHTGGVGVGWTLLSSLWGKPPRSASCATDGGGGVGKARSAVARSRPLH